LVVVPLVMLLIVIGVIAWVTQWLPSRGGKGDAARSDNPTPAVQFAYDRSTWIHDPDYTDTGDPQRPYLKLFEFGVNGYYDYLFDNITNAEAELGVSETTCKCSHIEVCLLTPSQIAAYKAAFDKPLPPPPEALTNVGWEELKVDREFRKSLKVPAHAKGVLRLHWKAPPANPDQANQEWPLSVTLWTRGAGQGNQIISTKLHAKALYVRSAICEPEEIDLGRLGPKEHRTGAFICWSGTRDLELESASTDKRIVVEAERLNRRRQRQWAETVGTKVYCAFRVKVTLHEQADGKQLDMGPVREPVPLKITSGNKTVEFKTPALKASVSGVVRFYGDTGGKIDLGNYSVTKGKTTQEMPLFAPQGAKVAFNKEDQEVDGISATVKEKEIVNNEMRWSLVVKVDGKGKEDAGLLPPHTVVVLRVDLPATADTPAVTRKVRIPIVGTAESR
jgi:hypothetical protein